MIYKGHYIEHCDGDGQTWAREYTVTPVGASESWEDTFPSVAAAKRAVAHDVARDAKRTGVVEGLQ